MALDRGSELRDAANVGGLGSEAIALQLRGQHKSDSNTAQLAGDTPIGHLNNARQILSSLYETLGQDARGAIYVGSSDHISRFFAEDIRTFLRDAARRIAKAVEQITPAPVASCSNCGTSMVVVTPRSVDGRISETLGCIFCGQEERAGIVLVAGELPFDPSTLAESQADGYELLAGDNDEIAAAVAIEESRARFRHSLGFNP